MHLRKSARRLSSPLRVPASRILAGSIAVFLTWNTTQAATVYLDINGTTAGSGITSEASILWDSSALWNTALDGTGPVQGWTAGNTAVFSAGTDATDLPYSVSVVAGGQSLGGLTVEEGHVSVSGGALTFTGAAALSVSTGADVTFGDIVAGTAGLNKTGAGTVTLAGNNTYSGMTTVSAGQLNINNAGTSSTNSAIGTSSLVLSGGTIDNTSGSALTLATNNAVTFAVFTFGGSNNLNFGTGAVTLNTNNASVTLNGTGSALTFGGVVTNNQNSSNESFILNGAGNTLVVGGFTSINHTGGKNLLFTGSGNLLVNGAVTNGTDTSLAVSWNSTGTLTLAGTNTYTGATTVGAGTVNLIAGNSLANTAITMGANATSSAKLAILTGVGGIFTAGNTSTVGAGATLTISPGTTALPQAPAFSMADNGVGTFNLVQESTFAGNALTIGSASVTGYVRPTLTFDIGGTSLTDIDRLNVTKLATVGTGGATINFVPVSTSTNLATGDYTFISASGGFSGTGGNGMNLGTTTLNVGGTLYSLSLANSTTTAEILTVSLGSATPANAYWTGAQGDGNWSSQVAAPSFATNFATTAAGTMDTFVPPGSTTNVFFTANSATNLNTTLNQSFTINSLTFTGTGTSNTAGTTISSGTGTNLLTINGAAVNGNVAANGITVAAGSGPNVINANLRFANGAQTWTVNTGATLTINGVVSDGGSGGTLTKAGVGTLVLTGANTYTGFTVISGGTLQASDSNVYTGATNTLAKVLGTGLVQPNSNATLQFRANGTNDSTPQTLTFGNQLQGAGGTPYTVDVDRQANTGGTNKTIALGFSNVGVNVTMNVTGADGFQLAIGQLQLGGAAAASTVVMNPTTANLIIASVGGGSNTLNPTLDLDGTAGGNAITGIIANNTTGTTSLVKTNTSTWTLSGASTYTGTTTISNGTLRVSNILVSGGSSNLGNATSAVTLGAAATQGTLSYIGNGGSYTRGFTIGGAGGGRLDVTTAGQALTVSGGNVAGTGGFAVGGAGNTVITSNLVHTGGLTKVDNGTLTLSGANTFSGGTVISGGALVATSSSALGSNGNVSVATGASLLYQPSAAGPLNLGTGTLTVPNGGTLGVAVGGTAGQSAITSSSAASLSGNVTLAVYGIPGAITDGANTVLTAASGLDGATYSVKAYNATNFMIGALSVSPTSLSLSVANATALKTEYWKGGTSAGTGVWAVSDATGSNWASDTSGTITQLVPGSAATVIFSSAGATNQGVMTLGADMSIAGLSILGSNATALNLAADNHSLTIGTGGISVAAGAAAVTLGSNVVLNGSQTWSNNASNSLTVSGAISGPGAALTLSGTGAITLAGANTYTGATTVNNSALTLSGSLTGSNVMINAGTVFNETATGSISGTANTLTLSQASATLAGANTYTGATTINGNAILTLNGDTGSLSSSSAINANIGKFVYTNSNVGGTQSQSLGAVTFGSASANSGHFVIENDEAGAGSSKLTVASSNVAALVGATANYVTTGSATIVATSGSGINCHVYYNGADYAFLTAGQAIRAPIYDGVTDGATFSTIVPSVAISGVASNNYLLTASNTAAQAGANFATMKIFGSSQINWTVTSGASSIQGILRSGGGTTTISGGNYRSTTGNNDITIRTDSVNDTIQFNAQISTVNTTNGATHLVKSGLGTLILNGNNTFAGNFFINEGTVKVTNAAGLGFGAQMNATYAAGKSTVNPGAVLDLNTVAGALTINEPIVLNGGSFINSNTSNGNLAKLDSGIAALVLTNTGAGYTGNPTVSFSGGGATTNATITATGSGTATITLTAAGTGYTSTPTITLSGGGATTNATVTATLSSLSLIGGSNSLGGAGNLTINAAIADGSGGSGGFTKTGNGTVTLGGANTYTGATNVSAGKLLVSGSITGSTATVTNSGSTLGGTGTIGSATVNSGAILQGGDGVSATGSLSSAGNISLTDGSEIKLTLGAGGTHSTLVRTGGLWSFDNDQAFIFNSGATAGTYQDIITGLTGSEAGLASIGSWTVLNPEYAGSTFTFDGSNVDLVLVPEPTPAAALLTGFAALLGLQRFRRRIA